MVEVASSPNRLIQAVRQIGPALVLATVVIGPGSLTLHTRAGSVYGYALLWVPVVATVLMAVFTWISARIGLVTGKTLFQVTREKYGARVAQIGGVFGYLAVLAFQAGNSAAVGFAMNAFFGGDPRLWATVLFFPALGLIFLPNLYGKLELLVKVIVGLMLLSFAGTLAIVGVDAGGMLAGLAPSFPDQPSIFLMLGMTATTFSIAAAVYQSYLMREKKWGVERLGSASIDTIAGIGILGLISIVILLTSAGAIYGSAVAVDSAEGMAQQLEPLIGPAAFYLFILGFFFASFSSLVVNPLIGATLLTDALDRDSSMDGRPVKLWTGVAMAAGLLVILLFKGTPVELIRTAQAFAVVAFPLLGFLVLAISRDKKLMGGHVPGPWVSGIALMGYLIILGIVINYLRLIITAL